MDGKFPAAVGIVGAAAALPGTTMPTDVLQERLSAAGFPLLTGVLRRATGIESRRIAADDEFPSTLAAAAAEKLIAAKRIDRSEIDLLIFASASRDIVEPATAHIVQSMLGTDAHAFDMSNACNSFLNGLDTARALILAGRARRALVVTGETPTRALRWEPRDAAAFRDSFAGYTFGDAGAAVLLEPVSSGGIQYVDTSTHSEFWNAGGIMGGGSRFPRSAEHTYFSGDGSDLKDAFEKVVPDAIARLFSATATSWDDYACVLVHQVTLPYLDRFVESTGAPRDKIVVTVAELGNVASATIPVQLAAVYDRLAPGDRVLFIGLGGGISIMMMVWEKA